VQNESLRSGHGTNTNYSVKTRKERNRTMKSKLVAITLAAGMMPLLSLFGTARAHAAGAGASSYTQTFNNQTDVSSSFSPCTGVQGTLTQTYNDLFHVTTLAGGEFWATFTQTGSISFVPYDSSQPSYSGHFTVWGGDNLNQQNATGTFTFNVRLAGTDGSVITQHEVAHYTVTATGVTYSFDKPTLSCG
jgi:hypothetical protein